MDLDSFHVQEVLEADHPRERLALLGVHSLTNTELMALLLEDDATVPGKNGPTERLLKKFRSLRTLARCSPREMLGIEGMTPRLAERVAVTFELSRRLGKEILSKMKVDSPEIVCQLMAQDLRALSRESLRVILLDTKYQLLCIEEISLGSINESIAHPREIFRPAIIHSAYAMILVHNHPSGDPTPSDSDKKITRRLVEVSKLLGVEIADHIIIGNFLADKESYFSFKEEDLI